MRFCKWLGRLVECAWIAVLLVVVLVAFCGLLDAVLEDVHERRMEREKLELDWKVFQLRNELGVRQWIVDRTTEKGASDLERLRRQ